MKRPQFDIVASGKKMREIRQARGISVKQVMEYMGFESTQAVYKWESGKCYPQADNLLALAILYNISPMELLVEEDVMSSSFLFLNYLIMLAALLQQYAEGIIFQRAIQSFHRYYYCNSLKSQRFRRGLYLLLNKIYA